MAETRFHNYKRPVDSFDENRRVLGIIEPGLYRGFDVFTPGVGLAFELSHGAKGITQTNSDNTTQTVAKGVLVTRHGGVVQEDAALALNLTTNTANTEDRYDLIVFEHQWLASVGGQAGVYSIIQGPNADPSIPALTNPKIQIALGHIKIPAGSILASECTWTRYREKGLGGTNVAMLDEPNSFSGLQSHQWATASFATYTGGVKALEWDMTKNNILIPPTAETFFECLPIAPDGTRVKIGFYGTTMNIKSSTASRMSTAGIQQTHGRVIMPTNSSDAAHLVQKVPLGISGKLGLSYVELMFRTANTLDPNGCWEVVNLGDRSLESSLRPAPMASGDWVDIAELNSNNGNKLDTGTTLGELNVKYEGRRLHLQGRAIIKIMTGALSPFYLVYPNATTQADVIAGATTWILKPIKIQNVTDSNVVDGLLYIYEDHMEITLASGSFAVGKLYNIHLLETILLKEV